MKCENLLDPSKKRNKPSFHQETNEDEVARVRKGLTTNPKMQQSRQRKKDEIAEEREDSLPTKENSNNSENSPVDCYKNARSYNRSSPSSKGNRRSNTRSPASSGQETLAYERPGQPDTRGRSHTPLPPGNPCKLKSEVNYRATWKRHIQLRILIAK